MVVEKPLVTWEDDKCQGRWKTSHWTFTSVHYYVNILKWLAWIGQGYQMNHPFRVSFQTALQFCPFGTTKKVEYSWLPNMGRKKTTLLFWSFAGSNIQNTNSGWVLCIFACLKIQTTPTTCSQMTDVQNICQTEGSTVLDCSKPVDQSDACLPNQMQDAHTFFMWNNQIKSGIIGS